MPREKISARPRNKSTWTCDGLAAAALRGTAVVDCLAWAKAPVENAISHAAAASFIGNLWISNLVSILKAGSPPVPTGGPYRGEFSLTSEPRLQAKRDVGAPTLHAAGE